MLVSFVILTLIFSFFELLGDIIRNRTPLVTVGEYLVDLTPSMIYLITPLGVLVAALVTFGVLSRSNELTAMKATGISLYRVMVPIVLLAATFAVALFLFDQSYLPGANRRQEALRSVIKGKPAQTFLRPDRKWIFGDQEAGQPGRIFYYQFFDPDHDRFANLTIFEFNPENFSLSRRIFASSAHWDPDLQQWILEQGWERRFDGEAISSYSQFSIDSFPEITEPPQYFKKEARQSQEMSFRELKRYIRDLGQSGFDTKRLSVQLNVKLAYPSLRWSWRCSLSPLLYPWANADRSPELRPQSGWRLPTGLSLVPHLRPSETSTPFHRSSPPGRLMCSSALIGGYLLLRTPT